MCLSPLFTLSPCPGGDPRLCAPGTLLPAATRALKAGSLLMGSVFVLCQQGLGLLENLPEPS